MKRLKVLVTKPVYVVIAIALIVLCGLTVVYITAADSRTENATVPAGTTEPEQSDTTTTVDEQESGEPSTTPQTSTSEVVSAPDASPKQSVNGSKTHKDITAQQPPACNYEKESGLKYKYNEAQDEAFMIRSKAIQAIRLQYIGYGSDNPEMLARIATIEEEYQNTLAALEAQYNIWRGELNCTY